MISITWTPLKGGRVRETVTFLVNDVLKHQAILLGNAEEQKKKKVIHFNHSVIYSKEIIMCTNISVTVCQ